MRSCSRLPTPQPNAESNRSALIRKALEEHLKRLKVLEMEEQERRAYLAQPQRSDECFGWESIAAWPTG